MLQYVYVFCRKYAVVHWLKMLQNVIFGIQITPLFTFLKCLGMHFLDRKYAVVYWLKMLQYTRGTQREYSSKRLKHSIVKRMLVFKR